MQNDTCRSSGMGGKVLDLGVWPWSADLVYNPWTLHDGLLPSTSCCWICCVESKLCSVPVSTSCRWNGKYFSEHTEQEELAERPWRGINNKGWKNINYSITFYSITFTQYCFSFFHLRLWCKWGIAVSFEIHSGLVQRCTDPQLNSCKNFTRVCSITHSFTHWLC